VKYHVCCLNNSAAYTVRSSTDGACGGTGRSKDICAGATELASSSAAIAQAQHMGDIP
jgi:hypothetical protein